MIFANRSRGENPIWSRLKGIFRNEEYPTADSTNLYVIITIIEHFLS